MDKYKKYKDILISIVQSSQGIKAVELVTECFHECNKQEIVEDLPDIPALLDILVKEKMIIEIEYCLPNMPERIKSFYLPVGTIVLQDQQ